MCDAFTPQQRIQESWAVCQAMTQQQAAICVFASLTCDHACSSETNFVTLSQTECVVLSISNLTS